MSKKTKPAKITRPVRDPDHYSKRMVPYWWSPEWTRGTSADVVYHEEDSIPGDPYQAEDGDIVNNKGEVVTPCTSYGRIYAVKEKKQVNLYMKSKEGNLSYIQGSIQEEFKRWHEDRCIDYMLLGMDEDEIIAQD